MGIRPNSRPTGFQLLLELLLVLSFVNVGLVGAQDISSVASESSFVSSLSESVVPEPTFSGPPITESTLSSPPVTESTLSSPSPTEEPVTTSALEPTSTTVRIVTRTTIPIEPATFSPFPIPSETPIPGAFPASKPKSPPPPDSSEIPSFGAAWQEAYQKAKEKITTFTLAEKVNVTTGVGWMPSENRVGSDRATRAPSALRGLPSAQITPHRLRASFSVLTTMSTHYLCPHFQYSPHTFLPLVPEMPVPASLVVYPHVHE